MNGINSRPAGVLMVQKLNRNDIHVPEMVIMTVVWGFPSSHGYKIVPLKYPAIHTVRLLASIGHDIMQLQKHKEMLKYFILMNNTENNYN